MKLSITIAIAFITGSMSLPAQQTTAGTSGVQGSTFRAAAGQSYGCVSIGSASGPQSAPKCGKQAVYVSPQTLAILQQAANCPVVLNASHLADGSIVRAGNGAGRAHPPGIGQWLHITVMTPTVSTASLLVHGFSGKARMTQSGDRSGPDAAQAVTVTFADKFNGQATGSVWVPGLTAVDSIDLVSLTYSDGSSWSAASGHSCRVTPDPLMLISGR